MNKTVAVFPNPYLKDRWSAVMHPLLSTWASSLKEAGWNVLGFNAVDLFNTELVKNISSDAIIIHWSETLTTFFINQHSSGKLLTSALSGFIPLTIRKKLADKINPLIMLNIDKWFDNLSKLNIKVFNQVHELKSHSFTEPGLAECDDYLKKKIFELSCAFLTQEESSVPLIRKFYNSEKHYSITYLGDYTKFHGEIIPKNEARDKLGIKQDARFISYIGTARKNRNPKEVINCYKKSSAGNGYLIVAGMGVGKYVTEKNEKIIVIDELIPNDKLRDIFCASDFVINDAKEYMTSAVIRTSISYQIPVIARKYGASIDMAKNAVIYIEDTDDGLEKAIRNAFTMNDIDYNNLVEEAKLRNAERPWNQYGKAFDELFKRLNNQ